MLIAKVVKSKIKRNKKTNTIWLTDLIGAKKLSKNIDTTTINGTKK